MRVFWEGGGRKGEHKEYIVLAKTEQILVCVCSWSFAVVWSVESKGCD